MAVVPYDRNNAENFNRLSRVHERYRQTPDRQTDGRTMTYSEREHEFTFANKFNIANICTSGPCNRLSLRAWNDHDPALAALRAWNRLATEMKLLRSTDSFRRELKTFYAILLDSEF